MKTVTIPTSQSPFVVMVNGAKYVYPAGSVQDVPDEVAVVIEAHNKQTAKPNEPVEAPFDCDCGGGGGAQSDWNQTDSSAADFIKNKPFGDMPTGGDTLYWDGNTEGLTNVVDIMYKVSDKTFTVEELDNAVVTLSDGTQMIAIENDTMFNDNGLIFIGECVYVATDSCIGVDYDGLTFSEVGIYCFNTEGLYVSSLTIPGYTGFPVTKKMEGKYLPGAVILYADAEMYLYATEDTSDTSKRMTKAELATNLMSGAQIYVYAEGMNITPAIITLDADYGEISTVLQIMFHTAEYVPEG